MDPTPRECACVSVKRRRKKRVCEPDNLVLRVDDTCAPGTFEIAEHPRLRPRPLDEYGHGRLRQRGGREERFARTRRKAREPLLDELVQSRRDWEGSSGWGSCGCVDQRASDLEREERVPTTRCVDSSQERAGEPEMQSRSKELVDRTEADGWKRQTRDLRREEAFDVDRRQLRVRARSKRREERDGLGVEPPQRELEHSCRRRIDPLQIVDCDDDSACRRVLSKRRQDGDAQGSEVSRFVGFR